MLITAIMSIGATLLFASSSALAWVPAPSTDGLLLPGSVLNAGEYLASTSNNTFLVMHPSGVLIVCGGAGPACADPGSASPPLWTSTSVAQAVPGSLCRMEQYGVLDVWAPVHGRAPNMSTDRVWHTSTMATAGCTITSTGCGYLTVQNDGNVVLYKGSKPSASDSKSLWATETHVLPKNSKNVLHIIVDDLRPMMNVAYHQNEMITPAFDRLAKEGLVFDRAYCNIAVCAPSRNSFMSGLRPDVTGIFNFNNHIREPGQLPIVTLPQAFKEAGYTVLGGGKTFHYNLPPDFDDVIHGSWSSDVQLYFPFKEFLGSVDMAFCPINATAYSVHSKGIHSSRITSNTQAKSGADMCLVEGDEYSEIYDYRLRNHTLDTLRLVKSMETPFFIMAGFRRPHRVFKVMKKYWDMYPEELPPAAKHQVRDAATQPLIAFHPAGFTLPNGTTAQGTPDSPWPEMTQRVARRAYSAAVTQTDSYIGAILDEIDALDLTHNTLVILHADHGWQLGEHGLWDKQTEFELATRVPLIMRAPWLKNSIGQHTQAFAELVDLHPTVLSLAGQQIIPPVKIAGDVLVQGTGKDLSPVFQNPELQEAQPGKNASYSQWPVCTTNASVMCMACTGPQSSRAVLKAMGYSVRINGWRYTTWHPFNTTLYTGDLSQPAIATELYDHRNASLFDFDNDGEAVNVAGRHEFAAIESMLLAMVTKQYTWDTNWLNSSRAGFTRGQLSYDLSKGFTPYN